MSRKTKAVQLTGAQLDALLTCSSSPEYITTALWHLRARTQPPTKSDSENALLELLLQPEPYESMQRVLSQGENVSAKHAVVMSAEPTYDESDQATNLGDLSPDEMVQLKEIWSMHVQTLSIILDTPESPATYAIAKNWMNTAVQIGNAIAGGVQTKNDE